MLANRIILHTKSTLVFIQRGLELRNPRICHVSLECF